MKKTTILFLFLLPIINIHTQPKIEITPTTKLINGYSKEIEGENLPYRSSYPEYAKVALLTRVTDGNKIISWETDPIPQTSEEYIYFYWLAGHSSGTSKADRHFNLFINDELILTFITPMKKNVPFKWEFEGKNNIAVMFNAVKQDAVDDVFGNMYLRIPSKLFKTGEKLKISVIGHNENSPDWYMTFKYSYVEKIDIIPIPAIIKRGDKLFRAINIKVDHIAEPNILNVTINDVKQKFSVKKGFNDFDVILPNNEKEIDLNISAAIPGTIKKHYTTKLKPAAVREIHLISHSHNDIGYSNLQEEVAEIQNKNIDDALRWIERTKDYPNEVKYRWNIESLWALDNYLRIASNEKKEKLFNAIKSGSIGLSAFYSHNLTGITKPEEFEWLIEYSKRVEKEIGVKVSNVMITDIPGVNWSIITSFVNNGIKYFSSGQNYFTGTFGGGDRVGFSNQAWGDKPFYWQSPSRNGKVLFWMAGRGYSYFHSFGPGDLFRRGKEHILNYLKELDSTKYPYDMIQLRYSIRGDNGPTDSTLSDFAKQWNGKYYSPKIILSTVESMFEKFEKKYGAELPIINGDFSPYWEDGAMSTAREENLNRRTADKIVQYGILASIIDPKLYNPESVYETQRNVVLFHEHTWGAWNSISDPVNLFVTKQWDYKKRFVLDADKQINSLLSDLLKPPNQSASHYIKVFNTCSWDRSDVVILEKEFSDFGNSIVDEKMNYIPTQKLSDGRLAFFAQNIPALGSKKFQILKNEQMQKTNPQLSKNIEIEFDKLNGTIKNIKWFDRELVDTKTNEGFNSILYVPGKDPKKVISEKDVVVEKIDDGNLLTIYIVKSELQGANSIAKQIVIQKPLNRVLVKNVINKKSIREKESVHIAFPINVANPIIRFDIGSTFIQPTTDLIYGSNKDYFCINKWIDVSNDNFGVTISPLEAPLFEIGELIDEDNSSGYKIWKNNYSDNSKIFCYTMNNYWHTNYKADQSGEVEFNFLIQPHNGFNEINSYRLGTEFQFPLVVTLANEESRSDESLFTISSPSIIVSSVIPQEKSQTVRLFNVSKGKVSCVINWEKIKPKRIFIIGNVKELELSDKSDLDFLPFEVRTIKIEL